MSVILVTAAILTVQLSSMLQISYAQSREGERLDEYSQREILDIHNREREAVGVRPLVWSDSLAAGAQAWAEEIASLRLRLDRCDQDSSQCPPPSNVNQRERDQGENIAWGPYPGREYRAASLAESWANERRNYVPGTPIEPRFGYPEGVYGHYTQMVWGHTFEIGCGFAQRDFSILVCRYAPGGNWIGDVPYDATPPPATNATALPATNATALPATNATALPATNATALPATNATAAANTNAPPPPPATNAPPPPPAVGEEQNTLGEQGAAGQDAGAPPADQAVVEEEVVGEVIQEEPPQ